MTKNLYLRGAALIAAAAFLASLVSGVRASPLVGAAVVLLATAGVSAAILFSISRRLQAMRETAAKVADRQFEARFDGYEEDEIGRLGSELNRLADRAREASTDAGQGNRRLLAVLDSSADAIVAIGPEGRIALANVAAEHLLGHERGQLIGSALSWILPDEAVDQALRAAISRRERSTVTLDRPPNQHLEASVTPIVEGGDWLVLVVFRDLAEARRIEKMRRDFVANVSHELRTPIASIKAVIETLEAGALYDKVRAVEFLSRADDEVVRLVDLVEQLLELSRLEGGDLPLKKETVDLAGIASNIVERLRPLAEQRRIKLDYLAEGGTKEVTGDRSLIERAVTNIVENALKFTAEDGAVNVAVSCAGPAVVLEVSDSGIGIDASDLPRIFERFYKVDAARWQSGTGLGLAIAKHAIESNGGHIEVESALGRGTTFRVYIPALTKKNEPA